MYSRGGSGLRCTYGLQGLPRDTRDDECDGETDRDRCRTGDDGKRDIGVSAGVVAVRDQGGAVEAISGARADVRGGPVPGEPECACGRECAEVVDVVRVDEPVDRW